MGVTSPAAATGIGASGGRGYGRGMDRLLLVLPVVVLLAVAPARAAQNDPRLDALFAALKTAKSDADAVVTERRIWQIWDENKNPEIERLLRRGVAAMGEGDDQAALAAFDKVVKYDKNFAEGWDKRATVEFAMGDLQASVTDIKRTLALEPRHFGAFAGLGQIFLAVGRKDLALKAFRVALTIDPHLAGVRHAAAALAKELKGTPL
jgi:tetratricopeptide (TPR) repeat protein